MGLDRDVQFQFTDNWDYRDTEYLLHCTDNTVTGTQLTSSITGVCSCMAVAHLHILLWIGASMMFGVSWVPVTVLSVQCSQYSVLSILVILVIGKLKPHIPRSRCTWLIQSLCCFRAEQWLFIQQLLDVDVVVIVTCCKSIDTLFKIPLVKLELDRCLAPVLNPFIRCIASEESRFQHLYVQISPGAKRRPTSSSTNDI
jgi:hypothetical protein